MAPQVRKQVTADEPLTELQQPELIQPHKDQRRSSPEATPEAPMHFPQAAARNLIQHFPPNKISSVP